MSITRRQTTRRCRFQLVAPIDMVVDHRAQQVMRDGNGVEIAGEMQVHFFHRHT